MLVVASMVSTNIDISIKCVKNFDISVCKELDISIKWVKNKTNF